MSLSAVIVALALQASAQAPPAPVVASPDPAPPPPAGATVDPAAPPYDADAWWSTPLVKPLVAQDPLWGRRPRRGEQPPRIDVGVEPSLYRLWGLQPLQSRILRRKEMILEVWRRPSKDLRQVVIRLTVRGDGRAFVNVRGGLLCCEPDIARRVEVDAELGDPLRGELLALRDHAMWETPPSVEVDYGGGAVSGLCIDGVAWDVILVTRDKARRLRRACDDPQIGQIADAITPALAATLGRDPRIDIIFPRGAALTAERAAYAALLAQGGRLKASAGASHPPDPPPAADGDDTPEDQPAEAPSPGAPGAVSVTPAV